MRHNPNLTASGASKCAGGFLTGVNAVSETDQGAAASLTATEKKVLTLLTMAKTNKEIAGHLNISPATVKRHLENILRKLALRNRVEAAIYGLMIHGCPRQPGNSCLLESWRNGRRMDSQKMG